MQEISRRTFIKGAAGLGAATVLVGFESSDAVAAVQPFSMATHIHASFSEGNGTMLAQLQQASATGVDVIWWTEHDWRMSAHGFWEEVHFTAGTETAGGVKLQWKDSATGSFTSRTAAFVTSPVSPNDPLSSKAYRLSAVGSSATAFAFQRRWADTPSSRLNLRGTLAGLSASIEVLPETIGADAFLEIRFLVGSRPATAGRASGMYSISYRIGGPDAPGTRRIEGLNGIVTMGAPVGSWSTITMTPCDDIAVFWPDLVATDAGMCEFSIAAASRAGSTAKGVFDYLRFTRAHSTDAVQLQRQIMDAYASAFPQVQQHQGLEVSLFHNHLNWFGGAVTIPDYTGIPVVPEVDDPSVTRQLMAAVRAAGGVASYNHIFGTASGTDSTTVQEQKRRAETATLVTERLYGADMVEVAYRNYGRVALTRHLAVWDACSRNNIFSTGIGSSDNHGGTSWLTQQNNFVTCAWAEDLSEFSLQGAMRAGRCYFADLQRYGGQLDMTVDGVHPMGSATVSGDATRELTVSVPGAPSNGTLRMVTGPVDNAGPATPEPGTATQTIPMSSVVGGQYSMSVDTTTPRFVRAEVWDSSNRLIAGSNPVWLLRDPPIDGIPPERAG